jgi:hypothetical protein
VKAMVDFTVDKFARLDVAFNNFHSTPAWLGVSAKKMKIIVD